MSELNHGDKYLLGLVRKGRETDGWAPVSAMVWPLVQKLPSELVTIEATETGGRARLTEAGETVLDWT